MPELTSAEIMALRKQAHDLDPILQIGKSGLSEGVVDEVKRQLKAMKLVKLKLLKSARENEDRAALAEQLAQATQSVLVEVRGNTVVLWKGKRGKRAPARASDARRED